MKNWLPLKQLYQILKTGVIKYLFNDSFRTDLPPGAVNGTAAEPGPGTRTVRDVESLTCVGEMMYFINDTYPTPIAAGAVNGTTAPVGGTRLVRDVENLISVN